MNPERVPKPDEPPPIVRHPDLTLPVGDAARGWSEPASIRVVEIARSTAVRFSGDQNAIACMAPRAPDGAVPWIYDLRSEWRAAFPQFETRDRIGAPRGSASPWFIAPQLVLSHDGRLAALAGDLPRVRVFEVRTGRSLWTLGPEAIGGDSVVTSLAFDTGGELLVTGDSRGRVHVWDAARGRLLSRFPVPLGFAATVGFHPDAETVAIIAGNEDAIRFWKHATGPAPVERLDHGDEVWGLAFTHNGSTLISAGDDDGGKAWDLSKGEIIGSYRAGVLQSAMAADPAGNWVAIGDFDGVVALRRGDLSGSAVATLSALRGTKVRAVALSPTDPMLLVAAGNGPRVLVASASMEGKILREHLVDTPHTDTYALAFSPDGRTLAMGSHAKAITLWDMPGFRRRDTLSPPAPISCVAYSPDGRTLVSGDIEGGLRFWDMPEGHLRSTRTRASETGGVWALAFSPDGKTLATGGDDKIVRLWDPEMALERLALTGHEAKVHAVAFSPDGKTLASADFVGKIRLWRTGP